MQVKDIYHNLCSQGYTRVHNICCIRRIYLVVQSIIYLCGLCKNVRLFIISKKYLSCIPLSICRCVLFENAEMLFSYSCNTWTLHYAHFHCSCVTFIRLKVSPSLIHVNGPKPWNVIWSRGYAYKCHIWKV